MRRSVWSMFGRTNIRPVKNGLYTILCDGEWTVQATALWPILPNDARRVQETWDSLVSDCSKCCITMGGSWCGLTDPNCRHEAPGLLHQGSQIPYWQCSRYAECYLGLLVPLMINPIIVAAQGCVILGVFSTAIAQGLHPSPHKDHLGDSSEQGGGWTCVTCIQKTCWCRIAQEVSARKDRKWEWVSEQHDLEQVPPKSVYIMQQGEGGSTSCCRGIQWGIFSKPDMPVSTRTSGWQQHSETTGHKRQYSSLKQSTCERPET